jgi:hypothetical protein
MLLWDKTDRQEYKNTFNCILTQNMDITWEGDTTDQKLDEPYLEEADENSYLFFLNDISSQFWSP